MLVLDASVAFAACASPDGFALFGREELVGPPLLWSEVRSAYHETVWRGVWTRDDARRALAVLDGDRIARRDHRRLGAEAWRLADELGVAKTYDAEYLALATLLRCRLVTLDARLRRAADRLGFVIGPSEL